MYDFMDSAKNKAAYGKSKPPRYEVTPIRLRDMSFWVGAADTLASPMDVAETVRNLKGKT